MSARQFRGFVSVLLALIAIATIGRVAVAVYDDAHPRNITVWCDANGRGDYNRSYSGPADLVLGACQMAAGTNNP